MKRVWAIIRPQKYFDTKKYLCEKGFVAANTRRCLGRGKKSVEVEIEEDKGNHSIYQNPLISKKLIEIYVRDELVDDLVNAIIEVNKTGSSGDGKIFVMPVEECIRIRSLETGDNALV